MKGMPKDLKLPKEEIGELHKEWNGQTIQDDEIDKMYKCACPTGEGPVHMIEFIYSEGS